MWVQFSIVFYLQVCLHSRIWITWSENMCRGDDAQTPNTIYQSYGHKPRQHCSVDNTIRLVYLYIMWKILLRLSICGSRYSMVKVVTDCLPGDLRKIRKENASRNKTPHRKLLGLFPTRIFFFFGAEQRNALSNDLRTSSGSTSNSHLKTFGMIDIYTSNI